MKFLLKDPLVAKLRKVPTFVWFFLLAATFFFAHAYVYLEEARTFAKTVVESYSEMFKSMDMAVSYNEDTLTIFFVVFFSVAEAFLYAGVFELFMRIAYNIALRRFAVASNLSDFTFRLRLTMIVANVILGLIGIFYFFFPKILYVMEAIVGYAIPTLFFALFYDDFRRKFVPKRNVAKLFIYIARIYIIVYFAISAFSSAYQFALYYAELSVLDIVALAIDPAMILLSALAAFFYANKLNKISLEEEDNELFIKKEQTPDKEDDNVFKDLGF